MRGNGSFSLGSSRRRRSWPSVTILTAFLATGAFLGRADEWSWESVGLRTGISAHTSANRFVQTEAYSTWNLPLRMDLGHGQWMRFQLDSAAGWLSGRGADGFVGSVGPALKFGREHVPVSLVGGVSPTVLSQDSFGNKNFGLPFQFTSHIGLELRPWPCLDLAYRFQHMSNGGLAGCNPGLNLHMFSLGYAF